MICTRVSNIVHFIAGLVHGNRPPAVIGTSASTFLQGGPMTTHQPSPTTTNRKQPPGATCPAPIPINRQAASANKHGCTYELHAVFLRDLVTRTFFFFVKDPRALVYITTALEHGHRPPAVICARVRTLVHMTSALVSGSTQRAVICIGVFTLLHITAIVVQWHRLPPILCTRVNSLVEISTSP